jgi:hypothetical protein
LISLVKRFHDIRKHRRIYCCQLKKLETSANEESNTFAPRCSDCNAVSGLEKLSLGDGVVDLRFEDLEEAVLAYLLPGLLPPQYCFCILAEATALGCHGMGNFADASQ